MKQGSEDKDEAIASRIARSGQKLKAMLGGRHMEIVVDDSLEAPLKRPSKNNVKKALSAISSISETLTKGETVIADEAFFPHDLVGGCTPLIAGQDYKLAWQAAAEATDTERVHIAWSIADGRVWFLAVRSSDLASTPRSWCPFAAVLPGQPAAEPSPVCYLHVGEEAAMLMTVSQDTLQIHRGTTAVIQAKAERLARDLGGAEIIQLMPEQIEAMTPAPWVSLSLLEEKSRRFLTMICAICGLGICVVAFAVWMITGIAMIAVQGQLAAAQKHASQAAEDLLHEASVLKASQLKLRVGEFAQVNDGLLQVGGWLKSYEITEKKVHWRAIVPFGVTSDKISDMGGHTVESTPDGYLVEGMR